MGLTAYTMGDIDTATARLLESIEVNPGGDQTSAWAHLGLIAQERHDLAAARRWLELAYDAAMAASAGWIQAFVMNLSLIHI